MIDFNHGVASSYALSSALLIYRSKGGDAAYVTDHPVVQGKNGPEIGAGRPITQESLENVTKAVMKGASRRAGLLPENTLSVGGQWIAWWIPSGTRNFFFQTSDERIGVTNGAANHPALFFVAHEHGLYVFALPNDDRPAMNTPLLNCPMMNVWVEGKVCLGTQPKPETSLGESVQEWTNGFFGSAFTHPNHDLAVKHKKGLYGFWRDNLDGKYKENGIPARCLVKTNKTVGSFLNMLGAI